MNDDCRYLFVYGTLMSGARSDLGHTQRLRLARESDSLGPASLHFARLYDLGRYPGAAKSDGEDDIVHGEAVLLADVQRTLKWTDAYEGFTPEAGDRNEYDRIVREVRLLPLFHEQVYRFARPEIEGLTVNFLPPEVVYDSLRVR